MDFKERLGLYVEELKLKEITQVSIDGRDLFPERASFQIGYNNAMVLMTLNDVDLRNIIEFRTTTTALHSNWSSTISRTREEVKKDLDSLKEEVGLFEKYFPRERFPLIYARSDPLMRKVEEEYEGLIIRNI